MLSRALIAAAFLATSAQAQRRNWEWFYDNMCGCGETVSEGCGMTSKQLVELLTTSPVLKMCKANQEGNASDTAEWMKDSDEAIKKRTMAECSARLHMEKLAGKFGDCLSVGTDEKKCTEGENAKYCEFSSQDKGKCGLDEEKLLQAMLGDELKDHPLLIHAVNMDKCSQLTSDACVKDTKCSWNSNHGGKCEGKLDVVYKSFLEKPALFELLQRSNREASCRSWHEHVWQGQACYKDRCHMERGICVPNDGGFQETKPNKTSIQHMRESLCWSLPRGDTGECPPGCVYSNKRGECTAKPGVVDDDANLALDEKDQKVAIFYMVMRSATSIQESRCNHYDEDMDSCKKSYEEHDVCNGLWSPNATEIFGRWNGGHRRHNNYTDAVDDLVNKTIGKVTDPDAGIGFNGNLDGLLKGIGEGKFADEVLAYFKDNHANLSVDVIKDFLEAKAKAGKTDEPEMQKGTVPESHFFASLCVALLGLLCGAFACGMWMSSSNRPRTDPLLQGYVRQGAPGSARELQHC